MAQLAGLRACRRVDRRGAGEGRRPSDSSGFMDLAGRAAAAGGGGPRGRQTPARAAGGLRHVHLGLHPVAEPHMQHADRARRRCTPSMPLAASCRIHRDHRPRRLPTADTATSRTRCTPGRRPPALRDLRDLYPVRAREAGLGGADGRLLPIEARDAARAARAEGLKGPAPRPPSACRYRAIAEAGAAANVYRRTATAGDARRIARRFIKHEDMILRFITRPDLDIFS